MIDRQKVQSVWDQSARKIRRAFIVEMTLLLGFCGLIYWKTIEIGGLWLVVLWSICFPAFFFWKCGRKIRKFQRLNEICAKNSALLEPVEKVLETTCTKYKLLRPTTMTVPPEYSEHVVTMEGPPTKTFLLLNSGVLQDFTNDELESMTLHEVGHLKTKFLWLEVIMNFFFNLFWCSFLVFGTHWILVHLLSPEYSFWSGLWRLFLAFVLGVLMIEIVMAARGIRMRFSEIQADLFSVLELGTAAPLKSLLEKLIKRDLRRGASRHQRRTIRDGHPSDEARFAILDYVTDS